MPLNSRDYDNIATFVVDEQRRRAGVERRKTLEKQWKEIDRQIAMEWDKELKQPKWHPKIELPLQATAFEIDVADAKRLLFPTTEDWWTPHVEFDDEWAERFREADVIVGVSDPNFRNIENVDQFTADVVVKGVIDHFHRQHDFRAAWTLMLGEAFKYGTYNGRLVMVRADKFQLDYRGVFAKGELIPRLAPVSVKNLYLDDAAEFVLFEGLEIAPSFIRRFWMRAASMRMAAATAPEGSGWLKAQVKRLEGKGSSATTPGGSEKKDHTEILEFEGDLFVPRSQGDLFLPNRTVTVAVDSGGPRTIRIRESPFDFRSYISGNYQKDQIDSPYGNSPLLKGRPLQTLAVFATNKMTAAATINVQPPVEYDDDDLALRADGGPELEPGAMFPTSNPGSIRPIPVGDPDKLQSVLLIALKMYEDLTGATEPRKGGELKSHTTAFAADVAGSRGLLRPEEFVENIEQGPMRNWLYMYYEAIKKTLKNSQSVFINTRGMRTFLKLNGSILPKNAHFDVHGSLGVINRRERRQNLLNLITLTANLAPLLRELPPDNPIAEQLKLIFEEFGIQDAERLTEFRNAVSQGTGQAGPTPPDTTGAEAA